MFCPKCGAQQMDGSRFCTNCGMKLDQVAAINAGTAPISVVSYAGFWRRFVAYIIDFIVIYAVQFVIGLIVRLLIVASNRYNTWTLLLVSYMISFVVYWMYWAFSESSSKQATPGKMAMGIKVTDANGNRISFARATGRLFAKILSFLILFIGIIMIAFTQKKQGLHDMMADTLVVLK